MKSCFATTLFVFTVLLNPANAYEINNHADMSQAAALISQLNDDSPSGKLFRLGLKSFRPLDPK